jgi:hypothetical protein
LAKKLTSYRFDKATLTIISEIRKSSTLSSDSDVLRKATSLLKIVVDNQRAGGCVQLKDKDGKKKDIVFT